MPDSKRESPLSKQTSDGESWRWRGESDPNELEHSTDDLAFSFPREAPNYGVDPSAEKHQFRSVSDISGYRDGNPATPTRLSNASVFSILSDQQGTPIAPRDSNARSSSDFSAFSPARSDQAAYEKVFVVPVRGSETPLTLANRGQGTITHFVQGKLDRANKSDVKEVALRMYKVLQEHGLAGEAERAFDTSYDGKYQGASAARGSDSTGEEEDDDELVGMDYILKDGIVSYLRDVAGLTPPLPQQVVRFYDINYSVKAKPASSGFQTFGGKLFNCFFGLFVAPLRKKEKLLHLDILRDISGYIMPGSMTLLLGPPGSGKSSLLKVLAGRAEKNKNTTLEGTILFNDNVASETLLTRLIAYINGQLNQHLPFLTVRETLEFAGDCTQSLKPEKFTPQMRKFFAQALVEGQDPYLEYILHVLGLKDIEHHQVGSGENGITENDLNRLTTAEIAMGTYSVMLYDQPCYAQESLATYDLVSTLRAIGRFQQCSAVMSLVQLSPEVFDLFDRIILLGEGQILYQGPRHDILHYFARLGFQKPLQMDPGDFLMEIAAGEGSQYLKPGYGNPSLDHLAMTYKLSDAYKDTMRIVHSEDVIHALWVESEPNVGLSLRKKERGTKSREMFGGYPDEEDGEDSRSSSSLDPSSSGSAGIADVEVVVSKLPSRTGRSMSSGYGPSKVRGIESSGTVMVNDLVTGISLPAKDMFYLNVSLSKNDRRSRASGVASMLANARGHVRLQVERIRDPETLQEEEAQAAGLFSKKYIQNWTKSTATLVKRQTLIHRRTVPITLLRLLQVVIMGMFAGILFYKDGGQYENLKLNAVRSVGFVTTGNLMLLSLVQLPLFMVQRPTFYKQRQQRFFRVSSYIITQSISGIPQAFLEALVYSIPVYFMVHLYIGDDGSGFVKYVLTMFVTSCLGTSVVLTLSGFAAILEEANAAAGLLVCVFLLFSGFIIYPSNMPAYWRWLAFLNPLRWANVAFCSNVFERIYTDSCNEYVQVLFYCKDYPGKTVGFAFLDHYQLMPGPEWYWISIAIIVGWTIFMNFVAYLAYMKIRHISVIQSLPSQTGKVTDRQLPVSVADMDARHDQCSRISWTGVVVEGGVDLQKEFPKGKKSPGSYGNYDLESLAGYSLGEQYGMEDEFSWRSSSLPVVPATLSFRNISLLVEDPRTSKLIQRLDGVSGYAKPGKMLAIMGGQKSGTSTLLKCLANRGVQKGFLSGEILVNGFRLDSATFSRALGFVERLDAHQPFLTVRESLMFSAALRLPNEVKQDDRLLHIDLILELLELEVIADMLVGSLRDATGVTFELAKKITIAVELAANPSILFLDEPTSGLDGLGARNIIRAIQIIAASGRTIITTIQHPSSRMLSAFQSAILLSNEGQQVYFGPVGSNCSHMLEYFGAIPKVAKYDGKKNPVTYVFDLLGCGIKTRDPMYDFAMVYRRSSLASLNNDELKNVRRKNKRQALKLASSGYAAPYHRQAIMVIMRTQKFMWRNVRYTFGRIASAIALSFLLGLVYLQFTEEDTLHLTSRSLFIYIQVLLIGVGTANNVVPQLGTDRLAYFRERRAGMYAPIFYPLSWALAELPYLLLSAFLYVAIGNGLAGIGTSSFVSFVKYWLALFVFSVSMAYFGMLITIATPLPILASFIVSTFTSIWILAAGVVVTMPVYNKASKWAFWVDPFQYAINTLTALSFYCDVNTPQCLACKPGGPCLACNCAQLKDLYYVFSWPTLQANRSIDYGRIPRDFAFLSGVGLLFAALAFVAFVFLKHNKP